MELMFLLLFLNLITICLSEPHQHEGKCGNNCYWRFDFQRKELRISGNGEIEHYTNDSDQPWKNFTTHMRTVVIEEGITSIGTKAFYKYKNVKTIKIPKTIQAIHSFSLSHMIISLLSN